MSASRAPLTLLTVPQAAARLGVHPRSVYRLIESGELRMVNVSVTGKNPRTRVRDDDLTAFIEARTAEADAPSTEDALAAST